METITLFMIKRGSLKILPKYRPLDSCQIAQYEKVSSQTSSCCGGPSIVTLSSAFRQPAGELLAAEAALREVHSVLATPGGRWLEGNLRIREQSATTLPLHLFQEV